MLVSIRFRSHQANIVLSVTPQTDDFSPQSRQYRSLNSLSRAVGVGSGDFVHPSSSYGSLRPIHLATSVPSARTCTSLYICLALSNVYNRSRSVHGPVTLNSKSSAATSAHMNDLVEAHSVALYTRVLNYSLDQAKVIFRMVNRSSMIRVCNCIQFTSLFMGGALTCKWIDYFRRG